MQLSSAHVRASVDVLCVFVLLAVGEGPEGDTEGSHIRGFRADE